MMYSFITFTENVLYKIMYSFFGYEMTYIRICVYSKSPTSNIKSTNTMFLSQFVKVV